MKSQPTISPEGPNSSRMMQAVQVLALTVLAHPDRYRVGARHRLTYGATPISRVEPEFTGVDGDVRPIEDLFISRSPVLLELLPDGSLAVDPKATKTEVHYNSTVLVQRLTIPPDRLKRGVALTLAKRVCLWVHPVGVEPERGSNFGLLGRSEGMAQVRRDILQVADLDVPVLIRGETGTGKELVARAIHQASRRRREPCEVRNMAAIPTELAASELFGHRKGAFSGADRRRDGAFQRAHCGTLFLDEVGDTPPEVQPLLLRALESGEIQPLGADSTEQVDVRLVAATDVDLETSGFRKPLLHRLASYQVHLPPLRKRREDVGLLFYHFVEEALKTTGELQRLDETAKPWVPATLLVTLARAPWPGNVRQLRNVAQQLVIANRGQPRMRFRELLERILADPAPTSGVGHSIPIRGSMSPSVQNRTTLGVSEDASSQPAAPPAHEIRDEPTGGSSRDGEPAAPLGRRVTYRKASDVGDAELLDALRSHGFRLNPTAKALGLSRTTLYGLVEANPRIRKGSDLSRAEIEAALEEAPNLAAAAAQLEVSEHALKLRMSALGL